MEALHSHPTTHGRTPFPFPSPSTNAYYGKEYKRLRGQTLFLCCRHFLPSEVTIPVPKRDRKGRYAVSMSLWYFVTCIQIECVPNQLDQSWARKRKAVVGRFIPSSTRHYQLQRCGLEQQPAGSSLMRDGGQTTDQRTSYCNGETSRETGVSTNGRRKKFFRFASRHNPARSSPKMRF